MFKIIGSGFIFLSSFAYFNGKNIVVINTIKLLKETQDIINKIILNYNINLTYIKLFERIELGETKYFKNFYFLSRNDFVYRLNNDSSLTTEKKVVINFIQEIGKYNRISEKEMLLNYKNNVEYQIDKLENKYKNENRINKVMGFGLGIIVALTVI